MRVGSDGLLIQRICLGENGIGNCVSVETARECHTPWSIRTGCDIFFDVVLGYNMACASLLIRSMINGSIHGT